MHRKILQNSIRLLNNSHLPAGAGGRSSWSGHSVCLFGGTGHIGTRVMNSLGKNGMACVLPHRKHDFDFQTSPNFDIGMIHPSRGFSLKEQYFSDDQIRDCIKHTNVVINVIGAWKPFKQHSMHDVNYDWPIRLANLVAEKNDGTKLINLTYLNTHVEKYRDECLILRQQHAAETKVKEIYPEAIRVRSSYVGSRYDNYLNLIVNERWRNFKHCGAWPLLFNGGKHTFHRPLSVGNLAEAIIRIAKHQDSRGQTFEIYGDQRLQLNEIFAYVCEVGGNETRSLPFNGIETTFDPETKERTSKPKNYINELKLRFLKFHCDLYSMPRPHLLLHSFDSFHRREIFATNAYKWISESMWYLINQTDKIEDTRNPGLKQLGITPTPLDRFTYEAFRHKTDHKTYKVFNSRTFDNKLTHYPESWSTDFRIPERENWLDKEYDLAMKEAWNSKYEEEMLDFFWEQNRRPASTKEMGVHHYAIKGTRRGLDYSGVKKPVESGRF